MSDTTHSPSPDSGIRFGVTDTGERLPVIDITHSAFAISSPEQEMADRMAAYLEESAAREHMSDSVRAMVTNALQQSLLGRALTAAAGGHVDGLTIYRLKLGPENLGSGYSEIDRRIAGSFPAWAARLRLQSMAQLLAGGLRPVLDRDRERPLIFLDIAGGPASDALNALLLIRAADADLLASRRTRIHVLDLDAAAPSFGKSSLAALQAQGGKLAPVDVTFDRVAYDWNDVNPLRSQLSQAQEMGALVAVSSEGGLFDYGSDDAIAANLDAVRRTAVPDTIVVGSFTRDDGPDRAVRIAQIATVPRSLDQCRALAARAGWGVEEVVTGPFNRLLRLRPAP